jgi:hypothetical protein
MSNARQKESHHILSKYSDFIKLKRNQPLALKQLNSNNTKIRDQLKTSIDRLELEYLTLIVSNGIK